MFSHELSGAEAFSAVFPGQSRLTKKSPGCARNDFIPANKAKSRQRALRRSGVRGPPILGALAMVMEIRIRRAHSKSYNRICIAENQLCTYDPTVYAAELRIGLMFTFCIRNKLYNAGDTYSYSPV